MLINKKHINLLVDGSKLNNIFSFILKPKGDIVNEVNENIKSHEKDIAEYEKVR